LTIKGTEPPECFFARLAAFFSFGVNSACFFASRLVRWDLDMVVAPDHVEGARHERYMSARFQQRAEKPTNQVG
jgi:hypothetical protein